MLERLERLKPDAMPPGKSASDFDSPDAMREWVPALMVCLAAAFRSYERNAWAKPSVDAMVKAAMACRRQLGPEQARQVEDWNQVCKGAAVARKSGAGGGTGPGVTSFDADAKRWRAADVSIAKKKQGGDFSDTLGNL